MATLSDRFIFSGASNGRAFIWRADLSEVPTASTNSKRLIFPNRLPAFEFQFPEHQQDISLITIDTSTSSLYCSSESQLIYKWNFYKNRQLDEDRMRQFVGGDTPNVVRFNAGGVEPRQVSMKRPLDWNLSSAMRSRFSSGSCSSAAATPSLATASSNATTPTDEKPPLGLITSWIYNCSQQMNGSQSEPPTKRLKTPFATGKCASSQTASKTANNSTKRSTSKRNSRRNLFSNNHKIPEYFRAP